MDHVGSGRIGGGPDPGARYVLDVANRDSEAGSAPVRGGENQVRLHTVGGAPALFDPLMTPSASVPVTIAPPLSPDSVHAVVAKPRIVVLAPSG